MDSFLIPFAPVLTIISSSWSFHHIFPDSALFNGFSIVSYFISPVFTLLVEIIQESD